MDTLPIEIYDEILKQLKHPPNAPSYYTTRLAPYSIISRRWQRVVERDIFHHIRIKSPELPLWKDVIESHLGVSRRSAIQEVTFATYVFHKLNTGDSINEAEVSNNMEFSRSIDDLFQLLGEWYKSDTVINDRMGCIHLDLQNSLYPSRSTLEKAYQSSSISTNWTAVQAYRRERTSPIEPVYLRYYGDSQAVPYISSFVLGEHNIWPASVMQLASRMENLTTFSGIFDDSENRRTTVTARRNHRKALGENLHLLPKSLQHLYLDMQFQGAIAGTFGQSALSGKTDDLCIGLRNLLSRLVTLALNHICISPALFWDENCIDTSSYPQLKSIHVGFGPISSYGDWFVLPDPNAEEIVSYSPPDSDDETIDRSLFNEPLLNELYISVGRAVHQMPSIERLSLEMKYTQSAGDCEFVLYPDAARNCSALLWAGEQPFEVEDEVWKAWRIERKAVEIIPDNHMYYVEAVVPWKSGGG